MKESARAIPIAGEVDVFVAGGSTWAVSAALAARQVGASVFLAAPRPYLGEDLCATLRLELEAGQSPQTELARRIFPDGPTTTPLRVKKCLDEALLQAGVRFVFGCYATDLIRDDDGAVCGVVMANRAGRQAVLAKTVIDAGDLAALASLAGARRRDRVAGSVTFERIVILPGQGEQPRTVRNRFSLTVRHWDFPSLCQAEQQARDRTYVEGQLRASESLFFVPPQAIVAQTPQQRWDGPERADLGHFRPLGVGRMYVLSGCADIPRQAAGELLRPTGLMVLAARVGQAAAAEALALARPRRPHVPAGACPAGLAGDVKELLTGLRPSDSPEATVPAEARPVEVLGRCDVVVVGGGTSGAAAAIGAARQGAKVLVVEYQEALGGVGTVGLIGRPYHGRKVGFGAEVPFPDAGHNLEHKMEWLRREVRNAGGGIWLGAIGCGACVEGGVVCGLAVATPQGRGVVLAKVVIDATGNADIAVAAGASCLYGATEDGMVALQGAGLPSRPLARDCVNTDYLLTDESDMVDVWRSLLGARLTMGEAFDAGAMIQTRERRRIVGEHVLSYLDQIAGRTYGDSIVLSGSDYDSHGYPNELYFALIPHDEETRRRNHPAPGGVCFTPYRCLIPRGLDGILVTGLGISMKRDACAMVRMQYDMLNQGCAAGLAAAMAVQAGASPRHVDVRALQRRLVQSGALPPEVLDHEDNFPLAAPTVTQAVADIASPNRDQACKALAIVLSHQATALPALREAFELAEGEARLAYARILAALGDARAVEALIERLHAACWDAKILQGKMTEYAHLPTPVDALVLALGCTKDRRALPAILAKLDQLDAEATLSHHLSAAGALERIADPAAAGPLARLLRKGGMTGHAMTAPEPLYNLPPAKRRREGALREIALARALVRCGDCDALGQSILRTYLRDLRGLLAQHARMVLFPDAAANKPAGR